MGILRRLKYRKHRTRYNESCLGSLISLSFYLFLIALGFSIIVSYWEKVFAILAILLGLFLLYKLLILSITLIRSKKNICNNANDDENDSSPESTFDEHTKYTAKRNFLTKTEKKFYDVFCKIVKDEYIVQPQVNLASIVNKSSYELYRNELFRNIDFGIFDKSYKLKLLIEINDNSHFKHDRQARDKKVRSICANANIPLITFWTSYGINEQYIENRLKKYLSFPSQETQ